MVLSKIDCKKIFKAAYENRYTWPKEFKGFKGRCLFIENDKTFEGNFILNKSFKPEINGISEENVIKAIGSQLFEVSIHRVKREFDKIHLENQFQFLNETDEGLEVEVLGKNEGDKYRLKDKRINMVFRKIHGVIIEIFVDEFFNTDKGCLSKKYTSQQLEIGTLVPKTNKYEYIDNFKKSDELGIWTLDSRSIGYRDKDDNQIVQKYFFKEISKI
tara:strand:- start:3184 stop:3831 length:648 start_codon:yes stop_codon:yes gene_type:complete